MRRILLAATLLSVLAAPAWAQLPPSIYQPGGPQPIPTPLQPTDGAVVMRGGQAYTAKDISGLFPVTNFSSANVTPANGTAAPLSSLLSGNSALPGLQVGPSALLPACPSTGCNTGPTFFAGDVHLLRTTHGNDAQETGMLIDVQSLTGAAPISGGSAGLNNGKEGLSITLLAGPNSGATWGLIVDAAIQASTNPYAKLQGHTTIEGDTNNQLFDAAPGAGALINAYWAGGSNAFPGTAMFYGDQGGSAGTYSWHYGFLLNDSKLVKDADFYSITTATSGLVIGGAHTVQDMLLADNAPTGIQVNGVHSIADMGFAGTGPTGISFTGTHTAQDISDTSTSPAAITFGGNHSLSIINAISDMSPNFAVLRDKQTVCFSGQFNCLMHNATAGKFYLTGPSNQNILSISDSGNIVAAGTITASATP